MDDESGKQNQPILEAGENASEGQDSSSESFGNVRKESANSSEAFGNVPKLSEVEAKMRTENHTLTVREVARLFEDASVSRTERTITNWCKVNADGSSKLDCFYDLNERKHFITPESVRRAIEEEQAKSGTENLFKNQMPELGNVPKAAVASSEIPENVSEAFGKSSESSRNVSERDDELMSLRIDKAARDQVIAGLRDQLNDFTTRLTGYAHRVGSLETKLLQLEGPSQPERPISEERPHDHVEAVEVNSSQV